VRPLLVAGAYADGAGVSMVIIDPGYGYRYTHTNMYMLLLLPLLMLLQLQQQRLATSPTTTTKPTTATTSKVHQYDHTFRPLPVAGAYADVVGCKIPRKENSPMFGFFWRPLPSCFPGLTRG